MTARRAHSYDVNDYVWACVALRLMLLRKAAAQRDHSLRDTFDDLRCVVLPGFASRTMSHDVRAVLRLAWSRTEEPSAAA